MNLKRIDLTIVAVYLVMVAMVGFVIRKKASSGVEHYFLTGRNLPWWVLGIAGCSSYIDIAGTMALVGALFYLGLKTVWMTNIFWGWFIMAGYMAFQAKWIKKHLKIKSFWGTTENAVRIQVYFALIAYCLVAIVGSELKINLSTYEILQVLGISLLDKTPVAELLTVIDY